MFTLNQVKTLAQNQPLEVTVTSDNCPLLMEVEAGMLSNLRIEEICGGQYSQGAIQITNTYI